MLEIKGGKFYLNNREFNIYSGAMHYFRIPEEYWRDRLEKLKASGLNTVETYVCWNLHEKSKGVFDFSGMLNVRKFILTAKEVGLYVILRPGPFICAEWDNGGFPAWLLKDKNMKLRCADDKYLTHVKEWFTRFFEEFKDLQDPQGGNIIAIQVENEYGSYGNDKEYIRKLYKIMKDCGAETFMFTADGSRDFFVSSGSVPELYESLTFGDDTDTAFDCLNKLQPDMPKTCMEYWDGWFEHWGEKRSHRPVESNAKQLDIFLNSDYNFNLYMFHGGTNFGFTAGANCEGEYQPVVTNYDYGAPLTENGDYTPLYFAIREKMLKKCGIKESDLPLPPAPVCQNIGKVKLTEFAGLFNNIDNISNKITSVYPLEYSEMDKTSGYVLYKTTVKGKYTFDSFDGGEEQNPTSLYLGELHDLGYVYVDGKFEKRCYRNDECAKNPPFRHEINVGDFDGGKKVEILVDAMGGVNYGYKIGEPKGIAYMQIGRCFVFGWECYNLDIDNIGKINFDGVNKVPCYLRGKFKAKKQDCFVKLDGFKKGFVVVNGHNLGRYWEIGPQKTLYLPGCWLYDDRDNEITVFEQEGFVSPEVEITDKSILG